MVDSVSANKIICFTDGSAYNNGKPNATAAFAVLFPDYIEYSCSGRLPGSIQTNNRAEYYAIIKAFEKCNEIDATFEKELHIHTDCMLIINSMTKWISSWKKKDWIKHDGKPVLNKDLLMEIDELMKTRKTKFIHVLAHTKQEDFNSNQNRIVDLMAKKANT